MAESACIVCTPGLCGHPQLAPAAPTLADQLALANERIALLTDLLESTRAELTTAQDATRRGFECLALFEKEVLRAYRRSKKRSGVVTKRPRRPRLQAVTT